MLQSLKVIVFVTLLSFLIQAANGIVSLQLRGRVIPSNGAGSVLITDIGTSNDDALLCISNMSNCCSSSGNWFIKYGSPQQRRVQSDDETLGWMRNRGRNPTVVRLRSRTNDPQPGQSQEGLYTCELIGDGVVSVGLYYSLDVQVTFQLSSLIVNPTYTVTCTVTGGTVLHSSFTGPGGEFLGSVSPVGSLERRGQDRYQFTVTKSTGNHGDTFTCIATNGASTAASNYTVSAATAPSNVTWEQVASSVLRVRWSQPAGGAPVRSYTVTAIYGKGVIAAYITLKAHHHLVAIQRLVNDGRVYTISVVALSDYLPGITSFSASLTQLPPPSFTITNITGTTANLTLIHQTALTTLTPDSYLITISLVMTAGDLVGCSNNHSNRTISMNRGQSFVVLNDLEEASNYTITIQALSQVLDNSLPSLPSSLSTRDAAPSESPRNLQVSEVTSSSVFLVWEPLVHCVNVNGVPNGWKVLYKELKYDSEEMFVTANVPGSPLVAGSANISGLRSYTNYTFQVAAVTGNELIGVYSNCVVALTLETGPGEERGEDDCCEGEEVSTSSGLCLQFQFGPTDYCITWTEEKAKELERRILIAISSFISRECPNCNESLFLGQHGMFLCHDNPNMPTYRVCPGEHISPILLHFIRQWVSSEPYLQVGWLLTRINPNCPVVIHSLDIAEQSVDTELSQETVSLPATAIDFMNICITELSRMCNDTSQ